MASIQAAGAFHPLYKAMSVCSSALQRAHQDQAGQREIEMLNSVSEALRATNGLLAHFKHSDADVVKKHDLLFFVVTAKKLNDMLCLILEATRGHLPTMQSANVKTALPPLLDELEKRAEDVDEMIEFMAVALDENLLSGVAESLNEIDTTKGSCQPWRKVLESV